MSLESAAIALDQHRVKRLMIDGADVDAWAEQHEAEYAKIKPVSEFESDVLRFFEGGESASGLSLPWQKTNGNFRVRAGEVTLWHGINGHGKSMVLGHVLLSLIDQGSTGCILSFEMRPVSTLARMVRQGLTTNSPSIDGVGAFFQWLEGKLWMYDQHGTVNAQRALAVVSYAAGKIGCKQIVIDSLMKCGIPEDDFNGQKRFIDQLCAIAKDYDCHVHLVHHARKGHNEDEPPGKMDAKGSGSITDQVDNSISVWRNKPKEREVANGGQSDKPDCLLGIDKQRHGEWEGRIGLWFHKASLQYLEFEHQPVRPMF